MFFFVQKNFINISKLKEPIKIIKIHVIMTPLRESITFKPYYDITIL